MKRRQTISPKASRPFQKDTPKLEKTKMDDLVEQFQEQDDENCEAWQRQLRVN